MKLAQIWLQVLYAPTWIAGKQARKRRSSVGGGGGGCSTFGCFGAFKLPRIRSFLTAGKKSVTREKEEEEEEEFHAGSSRMSRPRRLSSSSSLTRTLSRLSSSSSPSTSSTIAVRNEHTRIYTCLIAGALLLLASVTFLQVHLASAPQGSNILASPDNNENSGRSATYQHTHTHTFSLLACH